MRYESPETTEAAVELLAGEGPRCRVLAGGTDLLVQLRAGMISPERIVDIKRIRETQEIRVDDGALVVGAAVSGAELGEHPQAKGIWPGVVEAAELIGSTQIQGRATLGGNLCNASPAADTVPALIAAGARCRIAGPHGMRTIPVEDVCTGPGQISLGAGEFVLAFEFPVRPPRSSDAYLRFIPRTEMDIAVVGVGINLTLDEGGHCVSARVAVGAVAPTAIVVEKAGATLVGTRCDEQTLEAMAAEVRAACRPIDDKRGTAEYRTAVAGVLAIRATRIAVERARNA
ncbi:FAD binding domain-containing protein [Thioalkalivibrio sp. HK1]|uniref:FAD binding domain-containing protein n=1 Tax=Thioalkalivibrio sp. HK1 TaxID=1469245 RepID=UPI00046EF9E1|nr:xanthine dehydrogenase family protein subunit M [Thioalkalivibrio sp. HK1]